MGCVPLGLLRLFIYTSIFLVFVIGCILEIIFVKLANGKLAAATDTQTSLFVTGTVFFGLMIAVGILGICGVFKQSNITLIIYALNMAALFVGFWVVFVFMKGGKDLIYSELNAYCHLGKAQGFVAELAKAYPKNLPSLFCSRSCPCDAQKENFPSTPDYLTADFREGTGATTVRNCPTSPFAFEPKPAITALLGVIEEELKCSGICTKEKWYYYSDVNRGPPPRGCKEKLLDYIGAWYSAIYGIVIACAVITFLAGTASVIFVCCTGK